MTEYQQQNLTLVSILIFNLGSQTYRNKLINLDLLYGNEKSTLG